MTGLFTAVRASGQRGVRRLIRWRFAAPRLGPLLRRVPGAVAFTRRLSPTKHAADVRWAGVRDTAASSNIVRSGPFQGMVLHRITTGSHIPKRLGSYEAELHPLIESWPEYDRVIDIGCGEGWYVVGLARRMPKAQVWGFDTSAAARSACRGALARNRATATIAGLATPEVLGGIISGRALVIMDIEGSEDGLCDPQKCPALRDADLLVEAHDFLRTGVTERIIGRFPERTSIQISQQLRDPKSYPTLRGLSLADQALALDESRPVELRWLWLPKPEPA